MAAVNDQLREVMSSALAVITAAVNESVTVDSALLNGLLIQVCAFVLLLEVLIIGWSIARSVSPEARVKYVEITELIMTALSLSLMIKHNQCWN